MGKLTAGIVAACAVAALSLPPAAPAFQGGGAVLVVGDSLEVGSAPHLRQALAGVQLEIDAQGGRTSGEGLRVLAERLRPEHGVVAFPLGTNDLSASAFAANLAALRELTAGRCLVLATITRRGPVGQLNAGVEQLAGQGSVQVVDWRAAALSTPGVLGRDRVHATGRGYALRASLLAEAIQACLTGGDLGGIPAPENPNVKVPEERRRRVREPRPKPAPAARLPARAALLRLGSALERVVTPVTAALSDARSAATKTEPEPVLGAP